MENSVENSVDRVWVALGTMGRLGFKESTARQYFLAVISPSVYGRVDYLYDELLGLGVHILEQT